MPARSTFTSTVSTCWKPRLVIGSRTFTVSLFRSHVHGPPFLTTALAPFNLIALVIFRPLRLFLPSDGKLRQGRIVLLKATHAPIVGAIHAYEWIVSRIKGSNGYSNLRGPRQNSMKRPSAPPPNKPDSRPQSSYRPRVPSSQRTGAGVIEPRPRSQDRRGPEDDYADAPTSAEVQIAELASKIDRLTALVVALQAGQGTQTVRT